MRPRFRVRLRRRSGAPGRPGLARGPLPASVALRGRRLRLFGGFRRAVTNVSGHVASDLHGLHVQCIAPGSQVFHGRSYALIIGSRGRWHAIKIQAQSSSSSYHSGYVRIVTLAPRSIAHLEPHSGPSAARARPASLPAPTSANCPVSHALSATRNPPFVSEKGFLSEKASDLHPFSTRSPFLTRELSPGTTVTSRATSVTSQIDAAANVSFPGVT